MARQKWILLVEDSEQDLELTLEALEEFHLTNDLVVARDGAEALDCLSCRGRFSVQTCELPAVVLLDLKLPKVDGLEVLREMRSDPRLKHVPVVMLTSSREESDLVESYKLGVNAYVVKPVGYDEFGKAIRALGVFWLVLNEPVPRISATA